MARSFTARDFLVLCLLSLFGAIPISAIPAETNLVNWTNVDLLSAVTPRNLDSNIGQCVCDQNSDECDPFCCCDAACATIKAVENWEGLNLCRQSTISWRTFLMCRERNMATEIRYHNNQPVPDYQDEESPGAAAICLEYNNFENAIALTYQVPAADEVAAADIQATDLATNSDEWYAPQETAGKFSSLDRIPALYIADGTDGPATTRRNGFFTLPTPEGRSGLCKDDKTIEFGKPVEASRCFTSGTVEQLCSSSFNNVASTAYYKQAGVAFPEFASPNPVARVTTQFISATTGEVLVSYNPTSGANAAFSTDLGYTNGSPTCSNFVVGASLTIAYSYDADNAAENGGSIQSANYKVYVTDLSASSNSTVLTNQHEFAAYFVQSSTVPASQAHVTLRSGTPSYIAGQPINAGVKASCVAGDAGCDENGAKEGISQRVFGFSVPQGGMCSQKHFKQVRYQHNVLEAGCSIQLTRAELQTLCTSAENSLPLLNEVLASSGMIFQGPMGQQMNMSAGLPSHIGRTSDADPSNINDWIPLQGGPTIAPVSPGTYNSVLGRCPGLMTGLHFTFLSTKAGIEYNPQDVIVGAKVEPITGSWTFRNDEDVSETATSNFRFKFKVSFARLSSKTVARRPVPPRWLPEVDDDVFYPFTYPGARRDEN